MVPAWEEAFLLPLHPKPERLRATGIHENEDVLDALEGYAFPECLLCFRVRQRRSFVLGRDFEHAKAGELGNLLSPPTNAFVLQHYRLARGRLIPAEFFDEEFGEGKSLKLLAGVLGIQADDRHEKRLE